MKTCIGLDIGRSAVKIFSKLPSGQSVEIDFPSAVSKATKVGDDSSAARAATETIVVDGVEYFVGHTALTHSKAEMISGLNDDWVDSPQHDALFLAGLRKLIDAGVTGAETALIVVGLPARLYSSRRKAYATKVSSLAPRAEIKVIPQSMGPYYNMMLEQNGAEVPGMSKGSWGFIEVGQFTTDFALVDRGEVVERGFESCDGMSVAAQNLQRIMLEQKIDEKVTLPEATNYLAKPEIPWFGGSKDISAQVVLAVQPLAESIADHSNLVFGSSIRSLNGIRIAGGGASLVRDAIAGKWKKTPTGEDIPEAFISAVSNARFAVADGFFRFATALEAARRMSA